MATGDMSGKRVLVSGGTSGLGFSAAKQMAQRGATISMTGRNKDKGPDAIERLKALGAADAFFFQGNAGNSDDVQRITAEAAERMGGIDVLISAGAESRGNMKPFASFTSQQIVDVFNTLMYPRILPVHAAIPYLQKSEASSIVMLASDAARHITPGEGLVGAIGAVVIILTKSLARELGRDRIRVNSIALTITSDTPGWERAFANEFSAKVFQKAVDRFPFGRAPSADEVARAMVFLASDEASQISGQTISVNGALSFGGW